jgi:hypothetical protein
MDESAVSEDALTQTRARASRRPHRRRLEDSPISGIVGIGVHWEFKNRELFS